MLNHIVIMGRLTRDPELRRTEFGYAVASFSVAVSRDYINGHGERDVDFINCVAWRQKGEFVSKYFQKGSMIVVSGRLQMRTWTDDNGNKRTTYEIVAEDVYFGESKKSGSDGQHMESTNQYTNVSFYSPFNANGIKPAVSASEFSMLDDDDAQLPF